MKFILTCPTQQNEIALFSLDDNPAAIRLRNDQRNLHLYLDEPIPDELSPFLDQRSRQDAELTTASGRIAFGSKQARQHTTADIPSGSYQVTLYATNFPYELVETTIRDRFGEKPKPAPRLPAWIIWGSAVSFIGLWFLGFHLPAIACFFVPFLGWRLVSSSKAYRTKVNAAGNWNAACNQLEADCFPDVVIQMSRHHD